jgi:hypothetical protein
VRCERSLWLPFGSFNWHSCSIRRRPKGTWTGILEGHKRKEKVGGVCVCWGMGCGGCGNGLNSQSAAELATFGPRWVAENPTKPMDDISVTSYFIHV